MPQIRFFTAEQEASITQLQAKWQSIAFSHSPIDRDSAKQAIEGIYGVMGKPKPEVVFCNSPNAALKRFETSISKIKTPAIADESIEEPFPSLDFFKLWLNYGWRILQSKNKQKKAKSNIFSKLVWQLSKSSNKSLTKYINSVLPQNLTTQEIVEQSFFCASPVFSESCIQKQFTLEQELAWLPGKKFFFRKSLKKSLHSAIYAHIVGIEKPQFSNVFLSSLASYGQFQYLLENPPIVTPEFAIHCTWLDFAFSVLGYPCKSKCWQALQQLVQNCGWIFAVGNTCIICDRPTKILFDENKQLHAEGESALEYADGFAIYVYHGVILPEKYRTIHPNQWQPEWFLSEENRQIQKILIQGIGIDRLCQQLSLIEIEKKGEYTLLKLDENTGSKATYILQRINAKTGERKGVFVSWSSININRAIAYARKNYSTEDFPLPNE